MLAKDLISDEIPALRTSETAVEALNWMEVFRISHLPIVNNEEFLGLISEADIFDLNNPEEAIGNHKLSLLKPSVKCDQHIYEIMEVAASLKLTVVPVLDYNNKYLGVIQMTDLLHYFAKLSAIEKPGGIIVLETTQSDYSMTEISQIVESNDAKILSMYVNTLEDSTKLEVTLKINLTDLTSIIQTFNRYEYKIKASFMEYDEQDDLYNERYDLFMRYLST
ncbi:MAG: CBS domain-containing protein [Bacteroidales bacterium]|jgi:acetoin utilization protein AcuB|nr:CBS domain-containing protein [Bacteroidales bacterium]